MTENSAQFKRRRHWLSLVVLLTWFSAGIELRADQTVVVRSGNGPPIGSQDSLVRVLPYGQGNITPSAQDFVTVQTSPYAYIVGQACSCYLYRLPGDPMANWIATTPFAT